MMRSLWSISVVQLLRLILLVIRLVLPVVALTVHLPIELPTRAKARRSPSSIWTGTPTTSRSSLSGTRCS